MKLGLLTVTVLVLAVGAFDSSAEEGGSDQQLTFSRGEILRVLSAKGVNYRSCSDNGDGTFAVGLKPPYTNLHELVAFPITRLSLVDCRDITDLSGLAGLRLRELFMQGVLVTNLTPLQNMPLRQLCVVACPVTDLQPVRQLPLTNLTVEGVGRLTNAAPLAGMALEILNISYTGIRDLSPLKGMRLSNLNIMGTEVEDLSPLVGMPLQHLALTPENVAGGLGVLRGMSALRSVTTPSGVFSIEEFWQNQADELSAARNRRKKASVDAGADAPHQ